MSSQVHILFGVRAAERALLLLVEKTRGKDRMMTLHHFLTKLLHLHSQCSLQFAEKVVITIMKVILLEVTFTKEDLVCLARQLPGLLSSRYKPQT
jgi:hypothetical protein